MKRTLDWTAIKNALYLKGLRLRRSSNYQHNRAHWLVDLSGNYRDSTSGLPLTTKWLLKLILET